MENVIAMMSEEHAKALWISLGLSLVSTAVCFFLAYPGYDTRQYECEPAQLYRTDFHPSHVDELSAAHSHGRRCWKRQA